jgi:hypothetical protein
VILRKGSNRKDKASDTESRWLSGRGKLILGLGLWFFVFGWAGAFTAPAIAQEATEELFTPYLVASAAIPSSPELTSIPRSDLSVQVDPKSPYAILLKTAVRLVKRGHYGWAIALLEPYRDREDFLTLHALGVAYVRLERNSEAFDILARAHRLNPMAPGPLLPAALACVRMARTCDDYRRLALDYIALGGKFRRFADRIANHQPFTLILPKRS